MAYKEIRGTTGSQEIRQQHITRDARPVSKKIFDSLHKREVVVTLLFILALVGFLVPGTADIALLIALSLALFAKSRPEKVPFKLPIQANRIDKNEISPKDGRPSKAQGIFYLGNEQVTGLEIWLTNDDCRQHFLVLGTTGAGKTQVMISFASNAILWGSGFLYCDGKGDVDLFASIYALARRMGREDDLLLLNYMTGNKSVSKTHGRIKTNTMNPFASGSAENIIQMIIGLMADAGSDPMWKERATTLIGTIIRPLVWKRDQGLLELNAKVIRNATTLKALYELADETLNKDLPQDLRKALKDYLQDLPGWNDKLGPNQDKTVLEQHGYQVMQFTKVFSLLSSDYGHIFGASAGDIDLTDVVLNRRLLVIILPALEKATDELAALGKIIISNLKVMMGANLGSEVEGSWQTIVEDRATNSASPFLINFDEVGYYTVDGMNLIAAQARGLGFMVVYGAQDVTAMKSLNDKIAGSILANTNTQIIMKTGDEDTVDMAVAAGGKAHRAQGTNLKRSTSGLTGGYTDPGDAGLTEVNRVDNLDLRGQNTGEATVINGDTVIRSRLFYAGPEHTVDKKKLYLRTNFLIPVSTPDPEVLESEEVLPKIINRVTNKKFTELISKNAVATAKNPNPQTDMGLLTVSLQKLRSCKDSKRRPIETSCAALSLFSGGGATETEKLALAVKAVNSQSAPKAAIEKPEFGADFISDIPHEAFINVTEKSAINVHEQPNVGLLNKVSELNYSTDDMVTPQDIDTRLIGTDKYDPAKPDHDLLSEAAETTQDLWENIENEQDQTEGNSDSKSGMILMNYLDELFDEKVDH
ncbi:TraM recognition domain-containing protein [Flexibacterium corallicola]|uniref:TraM recognition domain-containing protein n=1 Tax=Flexibacterium corallicola TaxID=3037259 RepID=UPI00286F42DA|nr:TraM recognition domain-containing protein [Pseudovibrio sp. M1P-2-3]